MAEKIRLGNDIGINWSLIDEDGNPYNLDGRDVSVEIDVGEKKRYRIKELTTSGNTVSFVYWGKDQKYTGRCDLKFIENDGEKEMVTFDTKGAFELVAHSWLIGGEPETERVQLSFVTVTSELTERVGPKGDPGVGIESVVQTTTSTEDEGVNEVTVTLTDGTSSVFEVRNGSKGSKGDKPKITADADGTIRVDGEILTEAVKGAAEAEAQRVQAERDRASAETSRVSAETDRQNSEIARGTAELNRASAEAARVDAENSRAVAEDNRVTSEQDRESGEYIRRDQEAERMEAESARRAAETERASAESARQSAETARASAEQDRASAESARATAEQGRVSAEESRATAESERVAAETARGSASATAVQDAEAATAAANNAAEHAEEAATTIDEKIAEKANKDGYYGGMTVGTAENLVGRGSVEAEFQGIRTSAGNEDIGNGSATIREMRGKSIVWNQHAKPLDSSGWATSKDASSLTFSDGVAHLEATSTPGTTTQPSFREIIPTTPIIGHIYLVSFDYRTGENHTATSCNGRFGANFNLTIGRLTANMPWTNKALVITATSSSYAFFLWFYFQSSATQIYSVDIYFRNIQIIDLTLMFGEGNEPSTVEEFEAMFPLPYYDYDTGTIISNEATGIRTRGFNLYNHATGKAVLPGKYSDYAYEYEICGTFTSISFEDYAGNVSTPELHDGRFFNVPSPGVLTVTGGNDTNTLVHLVWSGWRNLGEPDYAYEKYWENTLQLNIKSITGKLNGEGESVTIFPEGMRGAGTAYDALIVDPDGYARRAIVRMGSVDMGTLTWNSDADTTTGFRTNISNGKKGYADMQMVSSKYIKGLYSASPTVSQSRPDKCIFKRGSILSTVIVKDTAYADVATFKAAMSGEELVYQLNTPLVYVLDTPIPMTYPVDDFSVEAKLPMDTAEIPTGPIRYTVTYPMNAADTLRRLPTNYMSKESMQNFLTALKTAGIIADFTMTYNSTAGAYTFTITAPSTETANTNESEL